MIIEQKIIPKGWQKLRLGDVAEITNGKTNSQDAIIGGEYPLFDRSALIKKSDKFLFDGEAIILPGEGAEFVPKYFNGKFDLHQRAYAIFACKEKVYSPFLYQFLFANRYVFAQNAVGSTVKSLRLPIIQKVTVNIPPINEQKKIAEILSAVDNEIEKTDEIILQTEKLRKGLMQDLFTKGIGHKKFKKTSLGDVPEEWDILKLKNVIKLTSGKFLSKKDFISGKFFVYGGNGISGRHSEYFLENPCIVIGRVGEYCGAVHLTQPKSWVTDNALYIEELKREVAQKFLYYFFIWLNFNQYAKVGGQPSISQNTVGSIEAGFPLLKEQQKIADILSSIDDKILNYKNNKNKLIQLKKGLMQDLLSGKIRIKI